MGTRLKTPSQFLRRQQTRKQWLRNRRKGTNCGIVPTYVPAQCISLTVSNPAVDVASLPLSLLSDSEVGYSKSPQLPSGPLFQRNSVTAGSHSHTLG